MSEFLQKILSKTKLPVAAHAYVARAIDERPHEDVIGHPRAVTGNVYVNGQSNCIQFGNRSGDKAFVLRAARDTSVLAIVDRPPPIDLIPDDVQPQRNGRGRFDVVTPSYLVVRESCAEIVDVRYEKALAKRAASDPDRWFKDDSGEWRDRRAEAACARLGLKYVLANADSQNKVLTVNLATLLQVRRRIHSVPKNVRAKVLQTLTDTAWISIENLRVRCGLETCQFIYWMIDQRIIHCLLDDALLTEPDTLIVAIDRSVARAAHAEATRHRLISRDPVPLQRVPCRKHALHAIRNLGIANGDVATRQRRRIRAQISRGAARGLSAFHSVLPQYRGNPTSPLPRPVKRFLIRHLRKSATKSATYAHSEYCIEAEKKHPLQAPVSLSTYRSWRTTVSARARAAKIGGRRSANAAEYLSDVEVREMPARRPLAAAFMDHQRLDCMCIAAECRDITYVARPWITMLIDESKYLLAFYLALINPSRASVAMCLRNCVRNVGALPENIHTDGGAEFRSTWFQGTTAHFGESISRNPDVHGRFNEPVERMQGYLSQVWISRRPGNIVEYRDRRSRSRGFRPEDQAVLSVSDLIREIEAFRQHYNASLVGNGSRSPSLVFNEGRAAHPYSGIPVQVDNEFLVATAIDKPKPYKVSAHGDVHLNGLHFTHPSLRMLPASKRRVPVRVDPEDPFRIYCAVDGQWITALANEAIAHRLKSTEERWAESILMTDANPVKSFAKKSARNALTKRMNALDAQREAQNGKAAEKPDLFAEIEKLPIDEYRSEERKS